MMTMGELTKTMHASQEKWIPSNWKKTLDCHSEDVENLVKMTDLFHIWSNTLHDIDIADRFIPEIFMDSYISIHFAGYGLYKYAHTCLRSQLETTLRLIYFSKHEIEYSWWSEGSSWFRDNQMSDVWGRSFDYFRQLKTVRMFKKECPDELNLFGKNTGVGGLYSSLSQFIHSGANQFQTNVESVSPTYEVTKFQRWKGMFEQVQECIHVVLALGFPDEFKEMGKTDRAKITSAVISNSDYKDALEALFPT